MKNILFLCTGNSCRSQMAEAFAKVLPGDRYSVFSAGIEKHGLNPMMLRVMDEVGMDMSDHRSKTVEELPVKEWFMVVTVCSHAEENCPFLPAQHHVHLPFDDPPAFCRALSDEEEILSVYSRVRDEIKNGVAALSQEILLLSSAASGTSNHSSPLSTNE